MTQTTKQSAAAGSSFLQRNLKGATFLALEHVMHLILTLVCAALVAAATLVALNMWMGETGWLSKLVAPFSVVSTEVLSALAIGLVAALATVSPLVWLLDKRVRAELSKRAAFTRRLAYKVPLYTAMGVASLVKIGAFIKMLTVVLYSLATMGTVSGATIGGMYRNEFLPALLVLLIFAATGWYMMNRAKGRAAGDFNMALSVIGLLLAIALFVTAAVNLQNLKDTQRLVPPTLEDYLQDYNPNTDYFNY